MSTAAGLVIYRALASSPGLQFLLLHASYEENLWTPPKGHLDPGEDLHQCAIRETEEECGLRVGADYKIATGWSHAIHYQSFGKPKFVTYYLAMVTDPEVPIKLSDEHRAFVWCDLAGALNLLRFKETIEVMRSAHEFIALSGQSD